jgi:hypothetical protein
MKKTRIFYWILTSLLAAFMLFSAIPDILVVPDAVAFFKVLGYPVYLIPFIGVAKLLGCIAILVPGNPRLKEWAYAGLFFDLAGAMYSSISIGAPFSGWVFFILPIGVLAASYILYHKLQAQRSHAKRQAYQHADYIPNAVTA